MWTAEKPNERGRPLRRDRDVDKRGRMGRAVRDPLEIV